jgi:hypothetical protein
MNHILYFKDDALFLKFKEKVKEKGSVSEALNEAMGLWLSKDQKWPDALINMEAIDDEYRFEVGREG